MIRLCFDYGHGGRDPGAMYKDRRESMDNLAIGSEIAKRVRIFGVEVDEIRTLDTDVSIRQRVDFANKGNCDYFISFQRSVFIQDRENGAITFVDGNGSFEARNLAMMIQESLVHCGFKDRGVKISDYQILRETKIPSVLVQIGFIDRSIDNYIFDNKRHEIVKAVTKAIILETQR